MIETTTVPSVVLGDVSRVVLFGRKSPEGFTQAQLEWAVKRATEAEIEWLRSHCRVTGRWLPTSRKETLPGEVYIGFLRPEGPGSEKDAKRFDQIAEWLKYRDLVIHLAGAPALFPKALQP